MTITTKGLKTESLNSPFPLRAGTGHQDLPHAVQLPFRVAEVPRRLCPSASEALSVVSTQVRAHVRLLVVAWRLVRPVALVHGISGRVLLVRPVEVLVDVLGIDLAGYRGRGRSWPRTFTTGRSLQLGTAASATIAGRLAGQRKCLHLPGVLTSARGRHCYDFLTWNRQLRICRFALWPGLMEKWVCEGVARVFIHSW